MTVVDDAPSDATALAGPATYATRVLQWSPVLVATVLAGVLHLLWWRLLATPGGDIAAQDAWAAFARAHPGSAYDLAWYGGMHPGRRHVPATGRLDRDRRRGCAEPSRRADDRGLSNGASHPAEEPSWLARACLRAAPIPVIYHMI